MADVYQSEGNDGQEESSILLENRCNKHPAEDTTGGELSTSDSPELMEISNSPGFIQALANFQRPPHSEPTEPECQDGSQELGNDCVELLPSDDAAPKDTLTVIRLRDNRLNFHDEQPLSQKTSNLVQLSGLLETWLSSEVSGCDVEVSWSTIMAAVTSQLPGTWWKCSKLRQSI